MPQIKYQTTNDIYYSGNVSVRFHFPIAFFAQSHQDQKILFDNIKKKLLLWIKNQKHN